MGPTADPAYEARLGTMIRRLGLETSVVLAGHQEEVARFYAAADAFVLPSLLEGWSLALTEAAVCGLPLIATAVGGAADLIGEVGGELVEPPFASIVDLDSFSLGRFMAEEDPAFVRRLADAMLCTCGRSPLCAAAALGLAERFDRRSTFRAHGRLFQWLVQGGSPGQARCWAASPSSCSALRPKSTTARAA